MFEKDLKKAYLLDFYGDVLTERKKEVLDMYYNEDLSLAEIAEQIGISRQGVRDLIKKAEEEIFFLEEKLGLAQKMSALRLHSENMLNIAKDVSLPDQLKIEMEEISKIIK
jgi:predicted DNA-binding protein YlxM (UPF0122 family)